MKEDLAIARNSLMALQAENLALRRNAQNSAGPAKNENVNNVLDHIDPEMVEALAVEKKNRMDVERELELQVFFNLRAAEIRYMRLFIVFRFRYR